MCIKNYVTKLYDPANWPGNLEVTHEEKVDADEKGLYILHSEVRRGIEEIGDKKATEDDNEPVDALRLLGKHGLKIMTQVFNIYVTGEWPNDFIEFTMIGLQKPNATKMQWSSYNQPHCTYSKNSSKDT